MGGRHQGHAVERVLQRRGGRVVENECENDKLDSGEVKDDFVDEDSV